MISTSQIAKQNIKNILISYIFIFYLFTFYYALIGYKEDIPSYMFGLQFYYAIVYGFVCISSISIIRTSRSLYSTIFLYSITVSIIIRMVSWHYLNEPFFYAVDSITYDNIATISLIRNMSISSYFDYILASNYGIDDFGMMFILYVVYNTFGDSIWGQNILLIFNSIIITLYSVKLNQILKYFNIQKAVRHFCIIAFGCFPFFSLTAAVGLKENFFIFIIILVYYCLIKYKYTRKNIFLYKTILFSLLALFFRLAIFLMLIVTIFVALNFDKEKNRKRNLLILILLILIGFILINILVPIIYGISLESVLTTTDFRSESMNNKMGGSIQWVVNSLSAMCGPFPNFNRVGQYAIVHSSGLVMKLMLNFYITIGLGSIILTYKNKQYYLLIYFVMNCMMLILAGVALDMRYHVTLFPIMIPVLAYTLQNFNNRKLYWLYFLFIISVVFLYNNR